MLSQEFMDNMKARLEEEKAVVEAKIADLSRPEEPQDNPNAEDLAQDATEDILEGSLLAIHRALFEKIDNALGRLKDGTFGRCTNCGAVIAEEDLEKEPWVEHCRACKPR